MTRKTYTLAAAGGSAALLLGALAFQFVGGLAPCPMCIWQRWPHLIAVLIGLLALRFNGRALPAMGALAALTTTAIGAYHAGVEQGWWPGPSSCTGDAGALTGLGGADLLSTDAPTSLVMCDEIVWSLAGISMAGWNAIISALLVLVWLKAFSASR